MELGLAFVLLEDHNFVLSIVYGLEIGEGVELLLHFRVCKQTVPKVQGYELAACVLVDKRDHVLAEDSIGPDADLQKRKRMKLQYFMQSHVE